MENNMNPNNGQFNQNSGQFNANNGQFNQNSGQFNANNDQFNQNNGQFNANNGQFNQNNGQFNANNGQFGGNGFNQYRAPIRRREIALCIIFSLLTCGIYGIYWMIVLNDEVNSLSGEVGATTGGMVFLFSILTCGIYGIYWMYKMGERLDRVTGKSNTGILYIVLTFLGLGIVSYALMQDTLNNYADM